MPQNGGTTSGEDDRCVKSALAAGLNSQAIDCARLAHRHACDMLALVKFPEVHGDSIKGEGAPHVDFVDRHFLGPGIAPKKFEGDCLLLVIDMPDRRARNIRRYRLQANDSQYDSDQGEYPHGAKLTFRALATSAITALINAFILALPGDSAWMSIPF
jgi:hypothetical protein